MIQYDGQLYGRIGRRYVKLAMTSAYVDALQSEANVQTRRACDAEERTNRLLQTRLDYQPWNESLKACVSADAKALSQNPEAYARVIAHELVKHIQSQIKHF